MRTRTATELLNEAFDGNPTRKVTVGCLIAVASISGAEAQQSPLPPVTVEAPVDPKKACRDETQLRSKFACAMHCAVRRAPSKRL